MRLADITWLQVENTTRCNAWCPGCARNQGGYGLTPGLDIVDLAPERLRKVLELLPSLQTVQFCGTYGDTMATRSVLDHLEIAMRYAKKLQIHTHGGFYNTHWWTELASNLKHHDHDVWFALDGLEGVHEIYRQGTDFNKTIANARSFISAGGHATWQFIPWQHNEHQIKDCMKLSQQIGFKKFRLIKNVRSNFQARNWKTGDAIDIKAWTQTPRFNRREIVFVKNRVFEHDCMHLSHPSIYLNANGKISVCCEFNLHQQHDLFDEIPDIKQELMNRTPRPTCLQACGSSV
jgi:sulfatase maturation enzyme AslB (radical SAM superfamily)